MNRAAHAPMLAAGAHYRVVLNPAIPSLRYEDYTHAASRSQAAAFVSNKFWAENPTATIWFVTTDGYKERAYSKSQSKLFITAVTNALRSSPGVRVPSYAATAYIEIQEVGEPPRRGGEQLSLFGSHGRWK